VRLELRQEVYDANAEIDLVYFPLTSVLSVVAEMQDGGMIEVGTIGYEGVSAIPLCSDRPLPKTAATARFRARPS
jgi:hypothetical protein